LGGVYLSKLSPVHIQGLLGSLERRDVTARVRQQVYALLHCALGRAAAWNLIPSNPCSVISRPRVSRRPVRALNAEEVRRLLRAATGDRLEALYSLAVATGLRQGELFGLKWSDIDLGSGQLRVQGTLLNVNGRLELGAPKTEKGRRLVELPDFAVAALREHRNRSVASIHPTAWVFANTSGGPLRKSNFLRRSFKPLLKRAGLPPIRFHDLRHTAASLMLTAGIHPKVVQERLGHSSISMTLDTYSHLIPSLQREAADQLDELIGSAS
jgi:integrase